MTKEHTSTTSPKLMNLLAVVGIVVAVSQANPSHKVAAVEGGKLADAAKTAAVNAFVEPSNTELHIQRGFVACRLQQWLNEFIDLAVAGDHATANRYLANGRCMPLQAGMATMSSDPYVCSATVGFVYHGEELWTVAQAVER